MLHAVEKLERKGRSIWKFSNNPITPVTADRSTRGEGNAWTWSARCLGGRGAGVVAGGANLSFQKINPCVRPGESWERGARV